MSDTPILDQLALETGLTPAELLALLVEGGSEAVVPNYLTVNPDGTISANFTGHVSAAGVDLPLTGDPIHEVETGVIPLPIGNRLAFVRSGFDNKSGADIWAAADAGSPGHQFQRSALLANVHDLGAVGSAVTAPVITFLLSHIPWTGTKNKAQISMLANDGVTTLIRKLLDSAGDSDFAPNPSVAGVDGQLLSLHTADPRGAQWINAPGGGMPEFIDNFTVDDIADYTFVQGGGWAIDTVAQVLHPTATGGDDWFGPTLVADVVNSVIDFEFNPGAHNATGELYMIFRLSNPGGNYGFLIAGVQLASSAFVALYWDSAHGFSANMATASITLPTNTWRWFHGTVEQNKLAASIWSQTPNRSSVGLLSYFSVDLPNPAPERHGQGFAGLTGFRTVGKQTDWQIANLDIRAF